MTTELLSKQEAEEITKTWVRDVEDLNLQIRSWLQDDPAKPTVTSFLTRNSEPPLPLYEIGMPVAAYSGEGEIWLDYPVRNYPSHGIVIFKTSAYVQTCTPGSKC